MIRRETGVSYPDSQGPLQDLICEWDREKLPEKTLQAEASVLEGLQQSSNGHSERDDITFGLSILKMIKRDRLGHPDYRRLIEGERNEHGCTNYKS